MAITPKNFRKWMERNGHSVRSVEESTGVAKSSLDAWLNGVGGLSEDDRNALDEFKRDGKRINVATGAAVNAAADMQALARAATAECIDLWRQVVISGSAPMAARLRASESLMSYGWGVPPKLQAERKVDAPAKDNELIEKVGRLAGA